MFAADHHERPDSDELRRSLAEARDGSPQAIGALLRGCREYLLLIANQELASEAQPKVGASDVVQESILHAYRGFAQFRGTTQRELLAWLRAIVTNQLANVHRDLHRGKRNIAREQADGGEHGPRCEPEHPGHTPATHAVLREETAALQRTLARLSADYQQVIVMRNWDRLPFSEIGVRLERTEEAARKLWYRAIQRLRDELEFLNGSQ